MKSYHVILIALAAGILGFAGGLQYGKSRQERGVIAPSSGTFEPVAIERVEPVYPASAVQDGIGGTVYVEVNIDEKGTPERVRIAKGVRADLDSAAVEAVRKWKYEPAHQDFKAVVAARIVPIKFTNVNSAGENAKYDLRCKYLKVTPEHPSNGSELEFEYAIENAGAEPILNSSFTVELYLDGKMIAGDRSTRTLPPGREIIYNIPRQPDLAPIKGGKHTYKLVIDGTNVVPEANKDNNVIEGTIEFSH